MMSAAFWDVMPCVPLEVHGRLERTHCFHFQGRTADQATNQQGAPLAAHLLLVS
jgi:hypothetical protein